MLLTMVIMVMRTIGAVDCSGYLVGYCYYLLSHVIALGIRYKVGVKDL